MEQQHEKCVVVLDETLPAGLAANAAAIMGITLGRQMPEAVGADVTDQSGRLHRGIITFPVPVLKSSPEELRAIREKLYQPEFQDLSAVDFSDLAQGYKTYEEFTGNMAQTPGSGPELSGCRPLRPEKESQQGDRPYAAAAVSPALAAHKKAGSPAAGKPAF